MQSSLSRRTIFPDVGSGKFDEEEEEVGMELLQKESGSSQAELDLNNETFAEDGNEATDYEQIMSAEGSPA